MSEQRLHEQTVELTRDLIRAQSLSGEEKEAAGVLAQAMERLGFHKVRTDRLGNVVGTIKGNRPGPKVLFDGHMDTVPVPDPAPWTHDPFGGEIENGRLYGRGASDMKGALAAMTTAAALFAARTGGDFGGEVVVAGVCHEEIFEGIAAREISAAEKPDVVVIGEASELNLKIGQRGRAEVVIETRGVPAHSASPEKGVNAVLKMAALLTRLEQTPPASHPVLGQGISVCTDILSTPYPGASVVPSLCRATFDRRILVGEDQRAVLAPFEAAIAELAAVDPSFSATAAFARASASCWTGATIEGERFFPAWLYPQDSDFVQKALAGLRGAGLSPAISHYAFCTNGSHYAGEAGIPTIGFGPSLETLAHTIDEYIEIEQLRLGMLGYAGIMSGLLGA
ncbi:peptidase M20 [Alkalidesulfovibrio alkalitolerans DSM 16529]|uniref:Peptidase M20 n=1 Tax=Alkalidesulfovibrio alkalitolerans DSM 16529 TaxID=1121439 RepID=S7TCD2_9BACT|nr:YgeY family selenium metabolism-linked hydrolase [Alkalidesulfovibrio alkalitolerans]EPR34867.1 peptidase M20 [Alkalidesulfovibrio alkalitolerans DSM 16529]